MSAQFSWEGPKTVLCALYHYGFCDKEDRCNYSHQISDTPFSTIVWSDKIIDLLDKAVVKASERNREYDERWREDEYANLEPYERRCIYDAWHCCHNPRCERSHDADIDTVPQYLYKDSMITKLLENGGLSPYNLTDEDSELSPDKRDYITSLGECYPELRDRIERITTEFHTWRPGKYSSRSTDRREDEREQSRRRASESKHCSHERPRNSGK